MDPELSVVTPMYNEEARIEENIRSIVNALEELNIMWEYVLVDDGSTDDSKAISERVMFGQDNAVLIHYFPNRGRGYALRQGLKAAKGKYIITTESDLSWGVEIISGIYNALVESRSDIVIASPYLNGGGYVNVPYVRRKISSFGNVVIRKSFGTKLTMLTGMTRGYRREAIKSIHLEERDKPIHLEIVSKALMLGYSMNEIPATIKWSDDRSRKSFRSQLKIAKFVIPHLINSVTVGAAKIISIVSAILFILGVGLISFGILNKMFLITATPKPNLVNYGLIIITLATISALLSIISLQLIGLKKHLVHLQSKVLALEDDLEKASEQKEGG